MEITEAPRTSHTDLKFRFTFDVTPYNETLTAKNISVTLGGKRLVEGLDLLVKRGRTPGHRGPERRGKIYVAACAGRQAASTGGHSALRR